MIFMFMVDYILHMLIHKVGKSGRRKRGGWPSPSAKAVPKRPRRGLDGDIVFTRSAFVIIIWVLMLV